MIRPMCGSSSATRAWIESKAGRRGTTQGSDVLAITPKLEEKLTNVRTRVQQHQQHGLG